MSPRRKTPPKQFSAYLVTWSDEPSMPVDSILIEKGTQLERDWNVHNFETGAFTCAVGVRLVRLCPDCRVEHKQVGILGHDGACGSEPVKAEAQQEIKHAIKQHEDGVR